MILQSVNFSAIWMFDSHAIYATKSEPSPGICNFENADSWKIRSTLTAAIWNIHSRYLLFLAVPGAGKGVKLQETLPPENYT